MGNAFTDLLTYLTDTLPDFFLAEPVIYFVSAAVLLFIIGLVARLFHSRY